MKLYHEQELIYEINVADMLWYSLGAPWEYQACRWEMQKDEEQEGSRMYRFRSGSISCTLWMEMGQRGCSLKVAFQNVSEETLHQFTGGITLPIKSRPKTKVTIPHLIYNDNPSADPDRIVAHIGNIPGEGTVVEEHRLPIPAVNIEWEQEGGYPCLTLLSVPDVVCGYEEEYWALGVLKEDSGQRIITTSGPLMFNGMKDVVYAGRCTPLSYMKGYRSLKSGETLTKTYYISWGKNSEEGRGFRDLTDVGYRILKPETVPMHTQEQMIIYKKMVMDSRFYQDEDCCGYRTFGKANAFGNVSGRPEYFLYGWTGQSVKLAWCDCALGLLTEEHYRLERGIAAADFFVRHGQSEIPGLYKGYYVIDEKQWAGDWKNADAGLSSRIQGESLCDLLDIMLLLREHGIVVPECWEEAVTGACIFLSDETWRTRDGIYPLMWEADGSIPDHAVNASGMPCVLVLVKAWKYFGCKEYLNEAKRMYERYAKYHMETFERPFARATMDARCEDKEAGIYFFTTAAELFQQTNEERFCRWAGLAADWILTFVFHWETGFQQGTACHKNGFKTTGWPGVSVQNHHLDVFFPTYELYEFGKRTGNTGLMEMAGHVRDALTYGVCTRTGEWGYTVIGEQGEQYYQTNYFQVPYPVLLKYLNNFRGGMQVWNPSWITAQVLSSAIKFHYFEN